MPKINRVRAVNVHYSDDTRCYVDQTFSYWGHSGLLHLANGGGKSVMIGLVQLVAQGVPDARKARDFLRRMLSQRDRYRTSHFMVEWLLDDGSYLLSGLCFAMGGDGEPRWHLYTSHYRTESPYDLQQFPLHQESGPLMGYESFKRQVERLARSQADAHSFSDDRPGYVRRLREFRIFQDEWAQIARSNTQEGGLTLLFEQCKTSRQIMEKVIVDHVAATLRDTDSRTRRTVSASPIEEQMREGAESVRQIPVLEVKIEEYERLAAESVTFREVIQSYRDSLQALFRLRGELYDARERTDSELTQVKEDLTVLEEAVASCKQQEYDLKWSEASVGVAELEMEKEERERVLKAETALLSEMDEALRTAKERLQLMHATDDWFDRREALSEAVRLRTKSDALSLDQPEILAQIEEARSLIRAHLERLRTEQANAEHRLRQKVETLGRQANVLDQALETSRAARERLVSELAATEANLSQIAEQHEFLRARFTEVQLLRPDDALAELRAEQANRQERRAWLEHELVRLADRAERLRQTLAGYMDVESQALVVRSQQTEALNRHARSHNELVQALIRAGVEHPDEVLYRDALDLTLCAMETEANERLKALSVLHDLATKKRQWLLGESRYINADVEAVSSLLTDRGMLPQTGMDWLKVQVPDADQRHLVLERHPLLPYGLIVEGREFDQLHTASDLFYPLFLRSPVPVFRKGEYLLQDGPTDMRLLIPEHGGTAVFHTADLTAMSSEVKGELDELENHLAKIQARLSAITTASSSLGTFRREYPEGFADEARRVLAKVDERLLQIGSAKAVDEREASDTSEKMTRVHQETADIRVAASECERQIQQLSEWAQLSVRRITLEQEKQAAEKARAEVDLQIRTGKTDLEGLRVEIDNVRADLSARKRDLEVTDQELAKYADVQPAPATHLAEPLLDVRARLEGLEESMSGTAREIEYLRQMATVADQRAASKLRQIKERYPFSLDLLEAQPSRFTDEAKSAAKTTQESAKSSVDGQRTALDQARDAHTTTAARLDERVSAIRKAYDREPAQFDEPLPEAVREIRASQVAVTAALQDLGVRRQALSGVAMQLQKAHQQLDGLAQNHPESNQGCVTDWESARHDLQAYITDLRGRLSGVATHVTEGRKQVESAQTAFMKVVRATTLGGQFEPLAQLPIDDLATDRIDQSLAEVKARSEQFVASSRNELARHSAKMDQLIDACLMRANELYDEVQKIPGYSAAQLPREPVKRRLLQIDFPQRVVENDREAMRVHILHTVEQLVQGEENHWPELIREAVSPSRLLNQILPLERVVVRVAKVLESGVAKVGPWEEAPGWSGGERYLTAFAIFLSLMAYSRGRRYGNDESGKVILSDNPFGATSSEHLLEPMRQLLEVTNTQWICATDLDKPHIFALFPIHYAIKPTPMGSFNWVRAKQNLNTAHYVFVNAQPDALHGPDVKPRSQGA